MFVLITGASSGVGRALVMECASQAVSVVAVGRDESALIAVRDGYTRINPRGECRCLIRDFADTGAAASIFAELKTVPLSAMFVCHGVRTPKRFVNFTNPELTTYNNAMMTSNVLLAKHFAAHTETRGNITFISSMHTFTRIPFNQNYGSVKRFLNHFVHNYQFEAKNMCVQVINPGRIKGTKFFDSVPQNLRGFLARPIPWALTPERVARIVLATLDTNFDVDVGWDAILSRIIFWAVPGPVIDFFLKRTVLTIPE
jgi:short-subunit dehydrogenase